MEEDFVYLKGDNSNLDSLYIINNKRKAEYNIVKENNKKRRTKSPSPSPPDTPPSSPPPNIKPITTELLRRILEDEGSSCDEEITNSWERDSDSWDELETDKLNKCPNPNCDHKDFTKEELKNMKKDQSSKNQIEMKSINDLIELGMQYHCKKNTSYYGVDLKILFDLVEPLTKLKNMVGMKSVKENIIYQIVFFLQKFNKKDKCNECVNCLHKKPCKNIANEEMLHTIITGSPGVGKTELGKILGGIYKSMGVLSNGNFHIATRSDLVGKFLGHTAAKTQAFINKCKGGVMFIDEAYSLGSSEQRDSFSKECLDTLNQNLSENRDLLVIVAGYEKEMDECFFASNPGLKRRFAFRYDIKSYTPEELFEIYLIKSKKDGWSCEFDLHGTENKQELKLKSEKKSNFLQFFREKKRYFVNQGGDVESLTLNCKVAHSMRVLFLPENQKKVITYKDLENGFELFCKNKKTVGGDDIKKIYTN